MALMPVDSPIAARSLTAVEAAAGGLEAIWWS